MSKSLKIAKENEIRYVQLGLNIAYYRKLSGMTQEELAEQAGISRSHISALEAPNIIHTISLEALFALADAMHIEASKLLEFRDVKHNPHND